MHRRMAVRYGDDPIWPLGLNRLGLVYPAKGAMESDSRGDARRNLPFAGQNELGRSGDELA